MGGGQVACMGGGIRGSVGSGWLGSYVGAMGGRASLVLGKEKGDELLVCSSPCFLAVYEDTGTC